jgi:sugar lactone lactonase YvrE
VTSTAARPTIASRILRGATAAALLAVPALSAGAAAAEPAAQVTVVQRFDPTRQELPESFTRVGDVTYLSMSSRLMRLSPDGTLTTFVQFPTSSPGAFASGVTLGPDGALYVGLASFSEADGVAGVWRVTLDGRAEEFVHLDDAGFPNDLAFDETGALYVTDPFLGRIWRVTPDGVASDWVTHPSLAGDPPLGYLYLHSFGADGIAYDRARRTFYVGNLDRGQLIRVPVGADGTAGEPTVWVDDERLDGVDGIAFSRDGDLYAAVHGQDQLARVTRRGEVSILASGGALDSPSAVEPGPHGELYVSSFAVASYFGTPRSRHPLQPEPALLRVDLRG